MVVQVEASEQDYCCALKQDINSTNLQNMPAETTNNGPGGAPRASLLCRPNSHPFQDRMLSLDQPVKVGRSVARARPIQTNAIFDCKDTKSSNGTFVNNQRLSKGSEESPPREVCSGDILQFGVDVMENSRKVTHGCIIATLKLYLPDGKEAKASPSIVNSSPGATIPAQDLYQLNQYIQEALAREQLLENKLLGLQRLIGDTEVATNQGWRALMDEDRLLTRVEILESQLTTYGKNMTEDKLREETKRLMSDKESYQTAAKDNLKRLVDEKLEASKKLNEVLEENKKLSEKITGLAEELAKKTKDETSEMNDLNSSQIENANNSIKKASELYIENEGFSENGRDSETTNGKYECESDFDKTEHNDNMVGSTDSLDGEITEDDEDEDEDDVSGTVPEDGDLVVLLREGNRLRGVVEEMGRARTKTDHELVNLRINLEEAKNENATILQELENTRNKLSDAEKLIQSQDKLVKDLEERGNKRTEGGESVTMPLEDEVVSLRDKLRVLEMENAQLQAKVNNEKTDAIVSKVEPASPGNESSVSGTHQYEEASISRDRVGSNHNLSSASSSSLLDHSTSSTSLLEQSLEEAETRIAGLLAVRDRLVVVQGEKSRLEADISVLEEELETLAAASRSLTACTVLPILVLIIAIVTAFLPLVSRLFGTRDF